MMTSAQVVETSVNVISNSPSQDYTHPDDRTLLNVHTLPHNITIFRPISALIDLNKKRAGNFCLENLEHLIWFRNISRSEECYKDANANFCYSPHSAKRRGDVVGLPFTNMLERGIAKDIKERLYWKKRFLL